MNLFTQKNKIVLIGFCLSIYSANMTAMCFDERGDDVDCVQTLKRAGVYYATDFAQYALLRTINPTQRVFGSMPANVQQTVRDGFACFKDCAQRYQNVKELHTLYNPLLGVVTGLPTPVDRLVDNRLGKLLTSYPVATTARILVSTTPEREIHRLIADKCARSMVPQVKQLSKKSEVVTGGFALACYRAAKEYAGYARSATAIAACLGYAVNVPYVTNTFFLPEIAGDYLANRVEGLKQKFGVRRNSAGDIILDYAAEQVQRDLSKLIWGVLYKADHAIERSLGDQASTN